VALVVNIIFCAALVAPLRQGGLALAATLAAYSNLGVLYWIFRRRLGGVDERKLLVSLVRISLATVLMGAACWWMAGTPWLKTHDLLPLLAWLSATILGSAGLYAALAWLFGAEELNEFLLLVTGRQLPGGVASLQAVWPATAGQK